MKKKEFKKACIFFNEGVRLCLGAVSHVPLDWFHQDLLKKAKIRVVPIGTDIFMKKKERVLRNYLSGVPLHEIHNDLDFTFEDEERNAVNDMNAFRDEGIRASILHAKQYILKSLLNLDIPLFYISYQDTLLLDSEYQVITYEGRPIHYFFQNAQHCLANKFELFKKHTEYGSFLYGLIKMNFYNIYLRQQKRSNLFLNPTILFENSSRFLFKAYNLLRLLEVYDKNKENSKLSKMLNKDITTILKRNLHNLKQVEKHLSKKWKFGFTIKGITDLRFDKYKKIYLALLTEEKLFYSEDLSNQSGYNLIYSALLLPESCQYPLLKRGPIEVKGSQEFKLDEEMFFHCLSQWEVGVYNEELALQSAVEHSLKDNASLIRDQKQLQEMAAYLGLECYDIQRDGNCFFHAVEHQMRERELNFPALTEEVYTHEALRTMVVNYVLAHLELYEDFIDENPKEFLEKIAKPGEWADHIVILTLARVLNVTIALVRSDGHIHFIHQPSPDPVLVLGYEVNHHYWSLLPSKNPHEQKASLREYLEQGLEDYIVLSWDTDETEQSSKTVSFNK